MTQRLFFVILYDLVSMVFLIVAIATVDQQKKQTRLLYAIFFVLMSIDKVLGAIAIHTGAFPLWNNK